jgi:SAM-dependent methyltransferase
MAARAGGEGGFVGVNRKLIEYYKDVPEVTGFMRALSDDAMIPSERVACNLCGADDPSTHMTMGHFRIVRCASCSLLYVTPRLSDEQLGRIYAKDYFTANADAEGVIHDFFKEKKTRQKDMLYEVEEILKRPGGRVLDIGCGPGFMLEMLPGSWEKHGSEFAPYWVEHCRKAGLEHVRQGDLMNLSFEPEFYDVVSARYILEHVKDPMRFLVKARQILKPGGTLLVSVPNWASLCARLFGEFYRLNWPNQHLYWFTTDSLIRYLKKAGFEVECVKYPYLRTSYFSGKELWNLVKRAVLLKLIMPIGMQFGFRVRQTVVSPPFYGNVVMISAKKAAW